VREALFDVLGQDLSGLSLLDAAAGSGIISFEAASRGALRVLAQDRNGRAVAAIRAASRRLGLAAVVEARKSDALRMRSQARYDLVFADPPYGEQLQPWLEALMPRAKSCLVLEHAWRQQPPAAPAGWQLRTRRYGDTALSCYRPEPPLVA